jgi:hypothetical protein
MRATVPRAANRRIQGYHLHLIDGIRPVKRHLWTTALREIFNPAIVGTFR